MFAAIAASCRPIHFAGSVEHFAARKPVTVASAVGTSVVTAEGSSSGGKPPPRLSCFFSAIPFDSRNSILLNLPHDSSSLNTLDSDCPKGDSAG